MKTSELITRWLASINLSKPQNTYKTCESAAKAFLNCVGDPEELSEKHYSKFLTSLKTYSPTTEKLYATLMFSFFEWVSMKHTHLDMTVLKYARRTETRKTDSHLKDIDQAALHQLRQKIYDLQATSLPLLRAKALVILAMESGLRISELCRLTKRNLNFLEFSGKVTAKGHKEVRFFFTDQAVKAIKEYWYVCARQEPGRGFRIAQSARPVFLSHSKKHAKILKAIDSDTGRADVDHIVKLTLKNNPEFKITPHTLRHYFGNEIQNATGNLETTRKAMHHASILTTQKYMHTDDEEIQRVHREVIWTKK